MNVNTISKIYCIKILLQIQMGNSNFLFSEIKSIKLTYFLWSTYKSQINAIINSDKRILIVIITNIFN